MKSSSDSRMRVVLRDSLRSVPDKMAYLINARVWLPINLFSETIEWLLRQPKLAIAVHPPFPNKVGLIGLYRRYEPTSFRRELEWAKNLVLFHSKKIQFFLNLRLEIQESILKGDYSNAGVYIESVENELGFSYWWIKHKLAYLQLMHGIEAQKKFAADIINQFPVLSINRFIVHQISIRNEPSVTLLRFVTQLQNEIDELPFTKDWKQMIEYHVLGGGPDNLEDATHVLRHASAESVVDLYEALIHCFKVIASDPSNTNDSAFALRAIKSIKHYIQDYRLDSLLIVLSQKDLECSKNDNPAFNKQLANTSLHSELANKALFDVNRIENYLLVANQVISFPYENSLGSLISESITGILALKGNVNGFITNLDRAAHAFPGFEVVSGLQAIAIRQLSPVPVGEEIINDIQNKFNKEIDKLLVYALSSIISFDPLITRFLPLVIRNDITVSAIDKNADQYFLSYNVDNIESIENYNYGLEDIITKALKLFNSADYTGAIETAASIIDCGFPVYEASALRIITYSLLKKGEISKCIDLVTEKYINNPSIRYILPIRELADSIDKETQQQMKSGLSLAILYDVYTRYIDGAYERKIRSSVSGTLQGNSVSRPSHLRSKADSFSPSKLVYFLLYTCIPETIYITGGYKGTQDLLEERIAILEWLIELDPENTDEYQTEIVNRTRRIVLEARRVDVEQSKIELNREGFMREAEKTTRESYERYIAYQQVGVNVKIDNSNQSNSIKSSIPLLPNPLPIDEASDLLKSMVRDLVNIFTRDQTYGLDGFLGTRIRHNVLESELRSSLVAARLVTPKEQGDYKFNKHWFGELQYYEQEYSKLLDNKLSLFAGKYDALITEIRDEWIRIKRSTNDKSMISIGLDNNQVLVIERLITERNASFEEFAQTIFIFCVNSLESCLTSIRNRLESEAKSRALDLIDELEREIITIDLQSLPSDYSLSPLINTIREVRGAIPRAFDRVISWFRTAYELSSEPLSIEDVIQISIEMVQHYDPRFKASIALNNVESIYIPGIFVAIVTDIFVVLFHNVLSRAGLGDDPSVHIVCDFSDDVIKFSVINLIGNDIDINEITERVNKIIAQLEDGSYRDNVRGESGTGLFRIHQLIRDSMLFDSQLRIAVSDNRTFQVEFNLPNIKNI